MANSDTGHTVLSKCTEFVQISSISVIGYCGNEMTVICSGFDIVNPLDESRDGYVLKPVRSKIKNCIEFKYLKEK